MTEEAGAELEAQEEHQEAEVRQGEAREVGLAVAREVSVGTQGVAVASAVEAEVHREGVAEDIEW